MSIYCVVFRPPAVSGAYIRRTTRFYLSAGSADRALIAAAAENPDCRVLGIEPTAQMGIIETGSHAA
jgi:hypothetical protein